MANNADLKMKTVVADAKIYFKEISLTLVNAAEINVHSGLIYCTDWKLWLEESDYATTELWTDAAKFDVAKTNTFGAADKCLKTKYYLPGLTTPRY